MTGVPMSRAVFEPLAGWRTYPDAEMQSRARDFQAALRRRRTVREFSGKPVPRDVIENARRLREIGYGEGIGHDLLMPLKDEQ